MSDINKKNIEETLELDEQEQALLADYNKIKKLPAKKHPVLILKETGDLCVALELDEQEQALLADYNKIKKLPAKKHPVLILKETGDLCVAVAEDGEITFGNNVNCSKAATEFWNHVKSCRVENNTKEVASVKSHCYDLIQENTALKNKLASMQVKLK